MNVLCECNGWNCKKLVEISSDEHLVILAARDLFVIVEGCPNGPDANDVLFENRKGYSLYRELAEDYGGHA